MAVLVQREMEKWRSPLASIPPASAGQLGEHRATQVATGELAAAETSNWFQERRNTLCGPRSHSPRGWKNKLARKENSDGPNAHTPRQATSVWSVSEMAVSRQVASLAPAIRDRQERLAATIPL